MGLHGSVGVHEEHPHRSVAPIAGRPHGQVLDAVAIKIPKTDERDAEGVRRVKDAREATIRFVDLLVCFDCPVSVQEQHEDSSGRPHVGSAQGNVPDAIVVEIAQEGRGPAEVAPALKLRRETALGGADLLV